jgi:hypothetical protein
MLLGTEKYQLVSEHIFRNQIEILELKSIIEIKKTVDSRLDTRK